MKRFNLISALEMVARVLMVVGLVAGTVVKVQKFAPLGDPMEIKVKNFNLSLRKSEAFMIELESTGGETI